MFVGEKLLVNTGAITVVSAVPVRPAKSPVPVTVFVLKPAASACIGTMTTQTALAATVPPTSVIVVVPGNAVSVPPQVF